MARKVFISSAIAEDEALIAVSGENPLAVCVWTYIIPFFDDWGRAEASAVKIKARAVPLFTVFTIELIQEALDLFGKFELIHLYEANGKKYMAIDPEKWFRYQSHIRAQKRVYDNDSPHPRPEKHNDWWDAQKPGGTLHTNVEPDSNCNDRALARTCAPMREDARICTPSPPPSTLPPILPSPSPSEMVGTTTIPPPLPESGQAVGGGSSPFPFSPEEAEQMPVDKLLTGFLNSPGSLPWRDHLNSQITNAKNRVTSRPAYLQPVILRILRGQEPPPSDAHHLPQTRGKSRYRCKTAAEANAEIDASLVDLESRYGVRNGKV